MLGLNRTSGVPSFEKGLEFLELTSVIASENRTEIPGEDPNDVELRISVTLRLGEVASVDAVALRPELPGVPSSIELSELAARLFKARRTRDMVLGRNLFGEPAWDMLLALYCALPRGEFYSISGLTNVANTSQATGHRWQSELQAQGLIERLPPGAEARRQRVTLTSAGRSLMDDFLRRLFCSGM